MPTETDPKFLNFANPLYTKHYGLEFDWTRAKFDWDEDLMLRLYKSGFVDLDFLPYKNHAGKEYRALDENVDDLLVKLSNISMLRPAQGRNYIPRCTQILTAVTNIKKRLCEIFGFKREISLEFAQTRMLATITFPEETPFNSSLKLNFSVYDMNILVNALNPTERIEFASTYLSQWYGPVFLGYFLYCGLVTKLENIDNQLKAYCNTHLNRTEVQEMIGKSQAKTLLTKYPNTYGFTYQE
jgi:hypothetical protein